MRRVVVSALVSLAWIAPALAQGRPQDEIVVPKASQETIAPQASQVTVAPKAAQETVAPKAVPGTVAPNVAQDDGAMSQITQSIERSVQARLGLAGFTDIQMIPTSFLIRARNRDGELVMMELSSDSLTRSQETPADQDDGGSRKDPQSGQLSPRFPSADDAD
jgi:hypothetical protein